MKVLISTSSFAEFDRAPLEALTKADIVYTLNPHGRKLNNDELLGLAVGMDGLIAGTETLTATIIKQLPGLRVISRCGAGMDNVDLVAAKEQGINVFNTPDAPTQAVAELTIGLVLNLLRRIGEMDRTIRVGGWKKIMGNLIAGKKVGIIGFGRIGRKTADLFAALGCEIGFFDPLIKESIGKNKALTKETLLGWADIVTIHVSGSQQVIGTTELAIMKQGAWLINVARGGVVDEQALYENLKNGRLAGTAIDVFSQEPYNGPLLELANVIVTPHIGSYAKEARIKME